MAKVKVMVRVRVRVKVNVKVKVNVMVKVMVRVKVNVKVNVMVKVTLTKRNKMQAISKAIFVGATYRMSSGTTNSGKPFCNFTLRCWKPARKDNQEDVVSFYEIAAYSGAAEVLSKYLYDGKLIYLECEIQTYKDRNDIDRTRYIVNEFSFLGEDKAS